MTAITGSDTSLILKQATTEGTAVQGGATDKIILESAAPSISVTVGESNNIGAGYSMLKGVDKLQTDVTISINQQARYQDAGLSRIMALFLGAVAAPAEQTVGEGDYLHRITHSATADKLCTIAYDGSASEPIEYPTCRPTQVTIETGNTPGYLTYTAEFIANDQDITSPVNTSASLAAATVEGDRKIVHSVTAGSLWINAQAGGALSSGDAINPDTVSIYYTKPKTKINTFGNSTVIKDGLFDSTITLTFPSLTALTWFTANNAGTEYKALFKVEGEQIGAGENYTSAFYFPKLKIVEAPDYGLSDPGINPLTVVFKGLAADANPTGMDDDYPYAEFINERSTALIS